MRKLEKLCIRTTDYCLQVASSDVTKELAESCSGLVIFPEAANINFYRKKFKNRVVSRWENLSESAFDKVYASFNIEFFCQPELYQKEAEKVFCESINNFIKVTDHLGLVLISDIPAYYHSEVIINYLVKKGIYESWVLSDEKRKGEFDLLFKVRKYNDPS